MKHKRTASSFVTVVTMPTNTYLYQVASFIHILCHGLVLLSFLVVYTVAINKCTSVTAKSEEKAA